MSESRSIAIEGGHARVVSRGASEAPSIVVVPPLAMPAGLLEPFAKALASQLRVHVVELPGAGGASPAPMGLTTRKLAGSLADVMRELGPPAHLFGVSFGGMIAQWMAIDAPTQIDRLVLASTAARGSEVLLAAPGEKIALFVRALGEHAPLRARFAEAIVSAQGDDEKARIEGVLERAPRPDGELVWLAAAVATHDTAEHLRSIRAPTLVLRGAEDKLIPATLQDALADAIPGSTRRVVAHAGHALTIDEPDACARAVLAFVT